MSKTIYTLKLHEQLHEIGITTALRVAGGWIYTVSRFGKSNAVFVPYSPEFAPVQSCQICKGQTFTFAHFNDPSPTKCGGCSTEWDGKTKADPK